MNTETSSPDSIMIEFREKTYPCHRLERNGQVIYQLVFGKSHLYMTKAEAADKMPFWTSIPEDPKLLHLVRELGQQIDKHFK